MDECMHSVLMCRRLKLGQLSFDMYMAIACAATPEAYDFYEG